jgi:hypothetical protein
MTREKWATLVAAGTADRWLAEKQGWPNWMTSHPQYTTDLNVLHKAEVRLRGRAQEVYAALLADPNMQHVPHREAYLDIDLPAGVACSLLVCASAARRAEALALTLEPEET